MAKEKYFTFSDFITHCGISKTKGYKLLQSGKIPYTKVHGDFYYSIPASSVYAYKHKLSTLKAMVTVKELSKEHNISYKGILEDIANGILKAKKLHRNIYYITKEDADKYVYEIKHPESVSVGEFGKLVGMYRTGVYKNIIKGTLPATKKGGRYVISLDEVEPFKKEHFVKKEINETEKSVLRKYYIKKYTNEPDAMTFDDIKRITGYSLNSISRMLECENVEVIKIRCKKVISKEDVIEFLLSSTYNQIRRKSNIHSKDIINALSRENAASEK